MFTNAKIEIIDEEMADMALMKGLKWLGRRKRSFARSSVGRGPGGERRGRRGPR
jgi:hypothetical protein